MRPDDISAARTGSRGVVVEDGVIPVAAANAKYGLNTPDNLLGIIQEDLRNIPWRDCVRSRSAKSSASALRGAAEDLVYRLELQIACGRY